MAENAILLSLGEMGIELPEKLLKSKNLLKMLTQLKNEICQVKMVEVFKD